MYIHRLVIDANQVNARQDIAAMNALEDLDARGLIEIFQTSTLPIEMRRYRKGAQKSRQYAVLASSSLVYVTNTHVADAMVGASARESRFSEIHQAIFGKLSSVEARRVNDMRDALHIDQAHQHDVDFFATDDQNVLNAATALATLGITTRVCTARECLDAISAYFEQHYGTTDASALTQRLRDESPILIGSNSFTGAQFVDVDSGEELLALQVMAPGIVAIHAVIRDAQGRRLLTITPGSPFAFEGPDASVSMEPSPAPLLVGEKTCRAFAINTTGIPALTGRILRSGRLLIHDASLYAQSGRCAIRIARDTLALYGVAFGLK